MPTQAVSSVHLACGVASLTPHLVLSFFFFNNTATTEIYTLSLHDALPICYTPGSLAGPIERRVEDLLCGNRRLLDRKSTRLNSSHTVISYAVFCLKKKKRLLDDELVGRRPRRSSPRVREQ